MKTNLKNLKWAIILGSLLISTASFADCLSKYEAKANQLRANADSDAKMTGLLSSTFAAGVLVPNVTSPAMTTTSAAAAGTGISYAIEDENSQSMRKVSDLLNDAHDGAGLLLNEFAEDTGLSHQDAVQFLRQADENETICKSDDNMLDYDAIVNLAASKN